mgnify:FL=1
MLFRSDLTPADNSNYTVSGGFRETVTTNDVDLIVTGSITSPSTDGFVTIPVPEYISNNPGIYILEAVITDDTNIPRAENTGEVVSSITTNATNLVVTTTYSNQTYTYTYPKEYTAAVGIGNTLEAKQQIVKNVCVVLRNTFYLAVERGIFGMPEREFLGPPSLAEVRLHIRDFPENNLLLDDYEFDEAEVYMAAERCVMYFNEISPPIQQRFTTKNFPFRYHWLEGIVYYLFITAADWHRRNK